MPNWIILSLVSAFFLGIYDIAKKRSVSGNAVPPVLLLSTLTGAIIWGLPVVAGILIPGSESRFVARLVSISVTEHGLIFLKSVLVGTSWTLAFFALKHLPLSIAAPIRATSPVWTVMLAVVWMGERPASGQWLGMFMILVAFLLFSVVGRREGIHFGSDRWVLLMILATLVGSVCGLYDKFLLQRVGIAPTTLQAWFSIYLVPVMLPLYGYWRFQDRKRAPFRWRWSIPLIAIFLQLADLAYFTALSDQDALVSVISTVRRSSVMIAFAYGVSGLKEKQWKAKLACLLVLLLGVYIISRG